MMNVELGIVNGEIFVTVLMKLLVGYVSKLASSMSSSFMGIILTKLKIALKVVNFFAGDFMIT